jgi:hypothetical protein
VATYTAGQVRLEVIPDMSKFASRLRAETRGLNETIKVGIDVDKSALAGLRADLAAVGKNETIRVGVNVDKAGLSTLRSDLNRVGGDRTVRVRTDVDTSSLRTLGNLADAAAGKVALIAAAAVAAGAALSVLPALIAGAGAGIAVLAGSFGGVGDALKAHSADQAKSSSGSSRTSDASQAASNARAVRDAQKGISDARTAAAQTARDSAESVQNALRSQQRVQKDSSQKISDALKNQRRVQEDTAERTQDALRNQQKVEKSTAQAVQKARQDQARAAEAGARSLELASRSVQTALKAEQHAEEDLTRARKQAQLQLEDLQEQVDDYALDSRQAALDLADAEKERDLVMRTGGATAEQRTQVEINLARAQDRVSDIARESGRAQAELTDSQKKGVEGSDLVVAAQERHADAVQTVKDAQTDLVRTQSDVAQANTDAAERTAEAVSNSADQRADAARQVADARKDEAQANSDAAQRVAEAYSSSAEQQADAAREVASAQRSAAEDNAAAQGRIADAVQHLKDIQAEQAAQAEQSAQSTNTFADAMAKLSPLQHELVGELLRWSDIWKGLSRTSSDAFLPGFIQMLRDAETLVPTFNSALERTGGIMGDTARDLGKLFKSPEFREDLDTLFRASDKITKAIGDSFVKLLGKLVDFGAKMSPVAEGFATFISDVTDGVTGFLDELTPYADDFKSIWESLGSIIKDLLPPLGRAIGEIAEALAPALQVIADFIDRHKDNIDKWILAIGGLIITLKAIGLAVAVKKWVGDVVGLFDGLGASAERNSGRVGKLVGKIAKGVGKAGLAVGAVGVGAIAADSLIPKDTGGFNQHQRDELGGLADAFRDPEKALADMKRQFAEFPAQFKKSPFMNFFRDELPAFWRGLWGSDGTLSRSYAEFKGATAAKSGEIWQSISGWFSRLAGDASGWFSGMYQSASSWLSTTSTTASSKAHEAWQSLSNWWSRLGGDVSGWFSNVYQSASSWLSTTSTTASSKAHEAWQGISNWWSRLPGDIGGWLRDAWRTATGWLENIQTAFGNTVRWVRDKWMEIEAAANTPVRWVIEHVYEGPFGIKGVWNGIAGVFGMPKLARGGIVPGHDYGYDTVPAMLRGGEGVLVPGAVRMLGGASGIHALNRSAETQHFATGGVAGFSGSGSAAAVKNRATGSVDASTQIGSFMSDLFTDPLGALHKVFADALRSGSATPGSGMWRDALAKIPVKVVDSLVNKAKSVATSVSSVGAAGGSGVQRWAPLVLQALGMMGQPASLLGTVLRRMNQESGGNPNIVNNWDINAKRGDPSGGLMQTIGATFRAYHFPGTSNNMFDPLANILASMSYAMSRYGSLSAAYNRAGGYDSGGWLPPGATMAMNNSGVPEAVLTGRQWQDIKVLAEGAATSGAVIHVYPRATQDEGAIAAEVRRRFDFSGRLA